MIQISVVNSVSYAYLTEGLASFEISVVEDHHEEEVEQPQVGEDVDEGEYHNEGTVCHINI